MGGLSEEVSRNGGGRIKVERNDQQQRAMKKITKLAVQLSNE